MTTSLIAPECAIAVHGLQDAVAALKAANVLECPVILLGAPYAGALWFKATIEQAQAIYPAVRVTALFDCRDDAGLALGALRSGLKNIVFAGAGPAHIALEDIVARQGANLWLKRPGICLDLRSARDPIEACKVWLTMDSLKL